jgi:hypothetical protein
MRTPPTVRPFEHNPNKVRRHAPMSPTERLTFEAVCRCWSATGKFPTATDVVNEIEAHHPLYEFECWEPTTYDYTFTTGPLKGTTERRRAGGVPTYGTIRCRLRDLTLKGKLSLQNVSGPRRFVPMDHARLELAEYHMPFLTHRPDLEL